MVAAELEPRRPCIGCAARQVRGRRYCPRCLERLRRGDPVDLDDYPRAGEATAPLGRPFRPTWGRR